MALRLIEMVLPQKKGEEVSELLKDCKMLEYQQLPLSEGEVLVRILLDAELSEGVLDLLEKHYAGWVGSRVVILPVSATLPHVEAKPAAKLGQPSERVWREELYEGIKDAARCSRVFLAMSVLSTIVAIVGLLHNSASIIIGAMVIAPSIGPSMAMALATTLGDLTLLRRSFLTGLYWIAISMGLSAIIGAFVYVDPTLTEVASRTQASIGDLTVALAAGCAGALGFSTGLSATLIGVMVAVAMLPPLATFGLLLGGGHIGLALGALSLFLMNLICVNLAGVTTFLMQGIHPLAWWKKERAAKATRIAIGLWVVLLAALVILIMLLPKGLI